MNEREMLLFAAKAAGYADGVYQKDEMLVYRYGFSEAIWSERLSEETGNGYWNPRDSDGDALRLAVKLNLHIGIDAESAGGISVEWDFDEGGGSRFCIEEDAPIGGDDCAATRRAIVRAAAEIGKAMP